MTDSLVSILIPVYNAEPFLPKCLDSVLAQTFRNLQVVMIDDGSTDGSWAVMQKYASLDKRFEIYHQENSGVSSTRNKLLEKLRGEYVLFVDADDWMEPDMVEFLVREMETECADVVVCGKVINDAAVKQDYKNLLLNKEETVKAFLRHVELRGSLCDKLFKASSLKHIRFALEISYGEDALFCWNVFQNIDKTILSDRQLYHYRMVASSLTHNLFGPKKFSAHYVWETICKETEAHWPQYLNIAQARHCVEDVLLMRDAMRSGYRDKETVTILRDTVKSLKHTLKETDITTHKMELYATGICYCGCMANFF